MVAVTYTRRQLGIDIDEAPASTRASMNGQVPASLSYYQWLKMQPASFVEDTLGPARAALFLKGGQAQTSLRACSSIATSSLTLEELRRLIPGAFEKAGV